MAAHFRIEFQQNPRVLLLSLTNDFRINIDNADSSSALVHELDTLSEPIVVIIDHANFSYDFDEILSGASVLARGENSPYHHPNIKKLVVVTTDEALAQIYRGLNSPVFGNVDTQICASVDEARDFARTLS